MSTKQIKVGITGGIRSGKDTVAEILTQLILEDALNSGKVTYVNVMGFADGITDLIKQFLPDLLEGGKPRKAYQGVGQELRKHDPDVWVKYADKTIQRVDTEIEMPVHHIVKDVRQPNEVAYLKEKGFVIIKVEAPETLRLQRATASADNFDPEDFEHVTEQAINLIEPDITISNNGTLEDLHDKVKDILQKIN